MADELALSTGIAHHGASRLPSVEFDSFSRFSLPASLFEAIPHIGEHDTAILMHNDGVVQGLSEVPFMQDVLHWGVPTTGTGLGNARFTNRRKEADKDERNGRKARE